jgi:hypothetical protein
MDMVINAGNAGEKSAAGVVLADGTIVQLAGEPPVRPPNVRMTGNGQR